MKAGKLVCGIVALISVPVMATSAQSVLRQARDDYYKSLKTPKAPKIKQQATSEETDEDVVEENFENHISNSQSYFLASISPITPLPEIDKKFFTSYKFIFFSFASS